MDKNRFAKKRLCALAAALLPIFSCSAVRAEIVPQRITLSIEQREVTDEPHRGETDGSYGGGEVDYSKVKVITHLRDGRPVSELEILDTLAAEVVGTDEKVSYKWQGSMDGVNWSSTDKSTSNQYLIDYSNNYKYLRCVAKVGRLSFRGEAVTVPTRSMAAPAKGEGDAEHQLGKAQEYSNPDYIFKVGGAGFVMLDEHDNSDAAFYVTTTEAYGDAMNSYAASKEGYPGSKCVSAHGVYTVADDGNSIGRMLTTLGNNYTFFGDNSNKFYALPQEMSEYISEKVAYPFWSSNWLRTKNFYTSPQTADIWMLAWDDFIKYSDRLGYKDNLFDVGGEYYFLRDGSPIEAWYANCVVTKDGMSACVKNGVGVIRPAFFLKEDFFKNVKLDSLSSCGEGVLRELRRMYSFDDLKQLYTAEELSCAGFADGKAENTQSKHFAAEVTLEEDSSLAANVRLRNNGGGNEAVTIVFLAYDEEEKICGIKTEKTETVQSGTLEKSYSLDELSGIGGVGRIDVFVLPGFAQ
ncbi:MAG: hypothetical protein ACI4DY_03505 [Monoglobaceae bacterium]